MTNLDWRQSFFQRLKVFGTLERPERKQGPFGGSRNTKLIQEELWKKCYLFKKIIDIYFWKCHLFDPVSVFPAREHVSRDYHKRKIKQAKTNKQWTGTEILTFKYSLFNWWARSTDLSNLSVLVQLSSWFSVSLFSWFSLFLAVHWEQLPHLSNKTPQSQTIYAR